MLHRRDSFRASKIMAQRVLDHPKVCAHAMRTPHLNPMRAHAGVVESFDTRRCCGIDVDFAANLVPPRVPVPLLRLLFP